VCSIGKTVDAKIVATSKGEAGYLPMRNDIKNIETGNKINNIFIDSFLKIPLFFLNKNSFMVSLLFVTKRFPNAKIAAHPQS